MRNVFIFVVAEVFVLVLALLLAVMRSLPGPVFSPLRVLAAAYTDLFRGVPTILRDPPARVRRARAPASRACRHSDFFWAIVALVLVYSAYVAEVYRAGIESVHPRQSPSARVAGAHAGQAMRFVVLPQAVRRVIPPLLNDFIGLQKDSALVAVLGYTEALRQAQIISAANFNFTPYVALALVLHRDHDPPGSLRRLARRARPASATGRGRGVSADRRGAADRGPPQVVRRARGAQGDRPGGRRARGRRA